MRLPSALAVGLMLLATPASAHEWVAYFEYGRAELSAGGYQMVRSVALYARRGTPTRVMISAFMDTAEGAEFSEELSRRRAQAVATELVALGIDPSVIVMSGNGATSLARPTPPNTSEPLNRRAFVGVNF